MKVEFEKMIIVEVYNDDPRFSYVTCKTEAGLQTAKVLATAVDFIEREGCDPREFFTLHEETSTRAFNARYIDHIGALPSGGVDIVLTSEAGSYCLLGTEADLDDTVAKLEACRQYIREQDKQESDAMHDDLSSGPTGCQRCVDAEAVKAALLRADTDAKAKAAWEKLFDERNRLWREEADRVGAVKQLIEENGCDCECECPYDKHDASCFQCLACRIELAIGT